MSAISIGLRDARTAPDLKPEEKRQKEIKQVAEGLEAHFMRQILSEFHMDKGAWTGGGMAGETFAGMLQEQLADNIAKAGGLGLGKTIAKALEENAKAADQKADPKSDVGVKALESLGTKTKSASPLQLPTRRSIQKYGGGYED